MILLGLDGMWSTENNRVGSGLGEGWAEMEEGSQLGARDSRSFASCRSTLPLESPVPGSSHVVSLSQAVSATQLRTLAPT